MRPRIESSIGDEAMEDCGFLKFTDDNLKATFLNSLSTMRKHRLFCDVILNVDNMDIHGHKNVLGCVSPHLMELFSAEQQQTQNRTGDGSIPSYRLNECIDKLALQLLVDYAYTAILEVPDTLVKSVYLAAWQLRMESVVKECARHLITELSVESCIETRSLPGINKNAAFVKDVDAYIAKEFAEVSLTPEYLQLQCIQIDILYQTKEEMLVVSKNSLCRLVLDWIKRQVIDNALGMTQLLERSHLLYLALDNSLQDCSDLPPGHESETELVQDYKRLVLKCPTNKSRRKCLAAPVRPRVIIYSRDIKNPDDPTSHDLDWNVIGSTNVAEHTYASLITLNGVLSRISIHLRLNVPSSTSPILALESSSIPLAINTDGIDIQPPDLFCEVATMSSPKCGLGVAQLEGKLFVCGGYDRGECLRSVESYTPETNTWENEPIMNEARGRFQIAVVDGTVFAVGGSNGTTELDTVECLPKASKKWRKCCKLPLSRSNAGVCALNEMIYCIGGWNGQIGIRQCDVFNPLTDKWSSVSSLNTGRYQAGVSAYKGRIWAVGGSDAWNCLGSVEVYDPEKDHWKFTHSLLTPRRGCGLAEFKGKLYAVGGSDGTHSLSSTEVYDEASKTWILGPNLTTPRSNVSVVVVQDKLYAIGGFSGKTFLNTMEYLDSNSNEWTTFVPQIHENGKEMSAHIVQQQLQQHHNGNHHNTDIDNEVFVSKTILKTMNGTSTTPSPSPLQPPTSCLIEETTSNLKKKLTFADDADMIRPANSTTTETVIVLVPNNNNNHHHHHHNHHENATEKDSSSIQ